MEIEEPVLPITVEPAPLHKSLKIKKMNYKIIRKVSRKDNSPLAISKDSTNNQIDQIDECLHDHLNNYSDKVLIEIRRFQR